MQWVTSLAAMQRQARRWKAAGVPVAFVPTMGALHAGHLSLVAQARRRVGAAGKVVVSIYVNPAQFGPREDLAQYPRDLRRDRRLCQAAGVHLVFAPSDAEMYPASAAGGFSTWVTEESLSRGLEGEARPTHFRGVTTVVAKLFHLVLPDIAVFGAKDFQQAAIVRRMVRDLNFPVRIIVAPTRREPDGLAMSSRNRYLSLEERTQATILWEMLQFARRAVRQANRPLSATALRRQLLRLITARPAARLDYLEFIDSHTLRAVSRVRRGTHLALAVFVGRTRLIDNMRLI